MENANCPCKKKNCERYGNCDECRKCHAESKRQRPVACEKQNGKEQKNPHAQTRSGYGTLNGIPRTWD